MGMVFGKTRENLLVELSNMGDASPVEFYGHIVWKRGVESVHVFYGRGALPVRTYNGYKPDVNTHGGGGCCM
jgi:hypothetical protein